MSHKKESKDDIVRLAAETGAKTALETMEKERRRERRTRSDRRLRNTKLLLRNYRMFKAHAAHAVYEVSQVDESAYDILDLMNGRNDSGDFVSSIKSSVARTVTIVEHVEIMLQLYQSFCYHSANPEEERRFRVIKALYIDDDTCSIEELAKRENVANRTIYRDITAASKRIAALIFGIDGIRKE